MQLRRGIGFANVGGRSLSCVPKAPAGEGALLSGFGPVARGAYGLGDDLRKSLLPKAAISIGAGSTFFARVKERMRDRVHPDAARRRKSFFCDRFSHAWNRALRGGL